MPKPIESEPEADHVFEDVFHYEGNNHLAIDPILEGAVSITLRNPDGNEVTLPDLFEFGFGPGSFAVHLERAEQAGAQVREFHSPGVSLDIDRILATRRGTLTTSACGVSPVSERMDDPDQVAAVLQPGALLDVRLQVGGGTVRSGDLESPRKIGRCSEEFLIEVVAPSSYRLGGGKPYGDGVCKSGEVSIAAPHHPDRSQGSTRETAEKCQTTFPDGEDMQPAIFESR